MRALLLAALGLTAIALTAGCADEEGCDNCLADQVCVVHFERDSSVERCEPAPASCEQVLDFACINTACTSAGNALCDPGYQGVGCSDALGWVQFNCSQ